MAEKETFSFRADPDVAAYLRTFDKYGVVINSAVRAQMRAKVPEEDLIDHELRAVQATIEQALARKILLEQRKHAASERARSADTVERAVHARLARCPWEPDRARCVKGWQTWAADKAPPYPWPVVEALLNASLVKEARRGR